MESLTIINERLAREFGYFGGVHPNYRVVHSEDQFEKRWVQHTPEGFELLNPIVEERPKYRQYIHNKYVLERCLGVPEFVETDLVEKWSYEPIWVFEDKDSNPLPVRWDVIKIVLQSLHRAAAKSIGAKYKDPEIGSTPEETNEIKAARIDRLKEELFGNETDTGDALAQKDAIVVPRSYENDVPKSESK